MLFDRWKARLSYSWPYHVFRDHHTELNSMYWAFAPMYGYAEDIVKKSNHGTSPSTLFNAVGPDARRLSSTLEEWQNSCGLTASWLRASCVIAACGYLEVYIKNIVKLAIMSDPAVIFGKKKAIDGVQWLKLGIKDDRSSYIEKMIKGAWPARVCGYKNVFGVVPSVLQDKVSELDKIRVFRNSVGHSFGRDLDGHDVLDFHSGNMKRISENRLKNWLDLINQAAISIDNHLLSEHIGDFESILFYHRYSSKKINKGNIVRDYRRELSRITNNSFSSQYCKDLLKFYDKI